ncbi:MAG: DUF5693 family protein, partial [Armatimonadota bacterium]
SWVIWTTVVSIIFAFLGYFNDIGRQLVALISAITFPLIAVLKSGQPVDEEKTNKPIIKAIARTAGAVLIVAIAGFIIAGLLSSRAYMMRMEMFAGVKIAHLLPILLAAFIYAGGIGFSVERYGVQKEKVKINLKKLLANPLYIWQAIAGAIALLFIALMLIRSGNQSGLEVSSFEIRFRSLLDQWLIVRPRTKEFLLGYPLLFTGIAFILRNIKRWGYPLIVVGTIGLVSSVNTFCHIHTPIWMSALRTFNGMVIGIAIGIVLYIIIRNLPGEKDN